MVKAWSVASINDKSNIIIEVFKGIDEKEVREIFYKMRGYPPMDIVPYSDSYADAIDEYERIGSKIIKKGDK